MKPITIVIDDREPGDMLYLLQKHPQLRIYKKRLFCGDYLIDDWLVVERKHLRDLIVSIIGGRLFTQCERLANSSYTAIIVIEGSSADLSKTRVDRRTVLGALACVSLTFGIPVLRTKTQEETVNLMTYSAQQHIRKRSEAIERKGYRAKTLYGKQLFFLQGIPQVGSKLAKKLLHHFGSIEALVKASDAELREVDGIGANIAESIRRLLTTKVY